MSITNANNGTNNNNNGNNNNNENNKKSKENLRELSYLIEEERLLADLKRESEKVLQKLKVEEITLLRFVRRLADQAGGSNRPIMLSDDTPSLNVPSTNNSQTNNDNQTSIQQQLNTSTTTPTISNTVTTNPTISSIEQDVNNSVLKLNVDNILMSIDNDQENEMEENEENGH